MNIVEKGNKIAFHPGYYIKEYIDDAKISLEELAIKLNLPIKETKYLLNGNCSLTVEIAERLSLLTGTSAKYWLNLQREFDSLCSILNN